jgi:hypothetical protein
MAEIYSSVNATLNTALSAVQTRVDDGIDKMMSREAQSILVTFVGSCRKIEAQSRRAPWLFGTRSSDAATY